MPSIHKEAPQVVTVFLDQAKWRHWLLTRDLTRYIEPILGIVH
ncbi:MAG: hypothetical protein ACJATP_002132 [Candidatus Azotimanducaceae bacterium]|jgi:hypothetical protein